MREDPRIFSTHTVRHLLVKDTHFLFLGPPGLPFFSGVCESGNCDEHANMPVAHGVRRGAHERRSEHILLAKKTS
jgi:hypothetical protein